MVRNLIVSEDQKDYGVNPDEPPPFPPRAAQKPAPLPSAIGARRPDEPPPFPPKKPSRSAVAPNSAPDEAALIPQTAARSITTPATSAQMKGIGGVVCLTILFIIMYTSGMFHSLLTGSGLASLPEIQLADTVGIGKVTFSDWKYSGPLSLEARMTTKEEPSSMLTLTYSLYNSAGDKLGDGHLVVPGLAPGESGVVSIRDVKLPDTTRVVIALQLVGRW
jgi:hypothetical protein